MIASIQVKKMIIPTYLVGEKNHNPMFLDKRVYQGSSGKVYPIPVIDKIFDQKIDKEYDVVVLENKYLRIEIIPELGGRIQRAFDKTNNYDFVYHNKVIKPALVGLAGPWISGGIEFNWPQHHRPSTFSPVEYIIEDDDENSKTLWVSEIDQMYGTKGMAGFKIYTDKAFLEINGQLFNGTDIPQTFLWWANPAVVANEHTKSIFPPDVNAVFDHGKRDVSTFPIATGEYYKADYSSGIDISMYKNIPVPTSYMAYKSEYNFIGSYDFSKNAGLLHIADHNISPGKKQWTWGNGDFGKVWDKNLTDEDGPYIELMTGVFTDNQPDFTWINPGETKKFKQYFMPYKEVGAIKNANIHGAMNIERVDGNLEFTLYTTEVQKNLKVTIYDEKNNSKIEMLIEFVSPEKVFKYVFKNTDLLDLENLKVVVETENREIFLDYIVSQKNTELVPDAAKELKEPEEIKDVEELYLAGLHLEQYRHATFNPEDYYLEGLKRDGKNILLNNAYGLLLYRRGAFKESEVYFRKAVQRSIEKNPNPYNGEPFYNLALSLKMQDKLEEAYKYFYKSTWNAAYQDIGFYNLAILATKNKKYLEALNFIELSLERNFINPKARSIKIYLQRKLSRNNIDIDFIKETEKIDRCNFYSKYELLKYWKSLEDDIEFQYSKETLKKILRDNYKNYIDLTLFYIELGDYIEAENILNLYFEDQKDIIPEIYYYLGFINNKLGNYDKMIMFYEKGDKCNPNCYFPNSLYTSLVLNDVIQKTQSSKAMYYLGCLYYDKKQYNKAISLWENAISKGEIYPTVYRNLALGYYNIKNKKMEAKEMLEKAFELNINDSRVLYELDQLYKKLDINLNLRLNLLNKFWHLVDDRDDLFIEYVTILNNLKRNEEALENLLNRNFHPWEGGEGKVIAQYIISKIEIAKKLISNREYSKAINILESSKIYPENFNEGKLIGKQENHINYYLGLAHELLDENEIAKRYYQLGSVGLKEPVDAMYYNEEPADTIFYQGLCLEKLKENGKSKFYQLLTYGKKHFYDFKKIDYFAVSLPDFLVFNEDLNLRNKVYCLYLMGLGYFGLGEIEKSIDCLAKAKEIDPNHQGLIIHLDLILGKK
ncbi:MAG: DUF5107 domain-containing protein [Cetobacterium sp.]